MECGFTVSQRWQSTVRARLGTALITLKVVNRDTQQKSVVGFRPSYLYVDEAAEISNDVWEYIMSRNRQVVGIYKNEPQPKETP